MLSTSRIIWQLGNKPAACCLAAPVWFLQFVPKPAPIMAPTRKDLLVPPPSEAAAAGAKLTKAEERAVGQVDRAIYTAYFRSWSPAFWIPATVLTLAMVERGLQVRRSRVVAACTQPSHIYGRPRGQLMWCAMCVNRGGEMSGGWPSLCRMRPRTPGPLAPPPQAVQNWWLSVWSEATAASEAAPVDPAAAAAAVDTTWYMMLYFAFGMTSLIFQVGAPHAPARCLRCVPPCRPESARRLFTAAASAALRLALYAPQHL